MIDAIKRIQKTILSIYTPQNTQPYHGYFGYSFVDVFT
jgi:hypothetical protein